MPDETRYYAFILDEDDSADDPSGLVRVIRARGYIRAEHYDSERGVWIESNSLLDRLYDPDEIDGSLVPIDRGRAIAVLEKNGHPAEDIDALSTKQIARRRRYQSKKKS